MKRNLYIIMVCCAAALVSCKKAETDTPHPGTDPEPQPEGKAVLYGSLGEVTKTYLSPNDDESQFDVYWEYQDSITIKKQEDGSFATFWTEAATGSAKTVPFKQKSAETFELEKDDIIEAFYPAELVNKKTGVLSWPAEQRYVVYSNIAKAGAVGNNPMWAKATIQTGTTDMKFYNLGGVIRFKLSQPTVAFNVVKAMISADQPVSGTFNLVDVTVGGKTIKKAVIDQAGPEITIIPEIAVTIAETGEASFYFAVPEGTYTGVQITLVGDDGKKVNARLAEGKTLEVKRAEVVRLTAQGVTPSMEGSNCFIGEGNVPIVITAMGNAFDGTNALDGNDEKAVWKPLYGNADACEVVWETVNTVDTPESGTIIKSATYTDGVLTVVPTGTSGNALVAVKKDGVIVWSYHIWVPETSISPVSVINAKGGFIFLDRNLGALKAADSESSDNTKSIGLFYQWGRKDPLLGYATFDYSAEKPTNLMNGNSMTINTTRSIESSIQHPDCIVGNAEQQFFTSESVYQLWGWTLGSNLNSATKNRKSIYDPCPAGYRVPGDSEYIKALGEGTNKFNRTAGNNTYYMSSSTSLIFPKTAAVYSNGTEIKNGGTYYYVWTAVRRKSDSSTAWYLNLEGSQTGGTYVSHVGNAYSGGSDGRYGSTAANVRCIKDQSSSDGYSFNVIAHEDVNFFD